MEETLDTSKIKYFVDSNPRYWGKKLAEKEIKSPQQIKDKDPILIISRSYQEEIIVQIKDQLKLDNYVMVLYE
jgi:hypothetical protein